MRKTRSRLVGLVMAVAMALVMAPSVALGDTSAPTASGSSFFANGTAIKITNSAPEGAEEANYEPDFTAKGKDAYISWDDNGKTQYVGVSSGITVWGGADGSSNAVSVASTSIEMTGGTVRKILGGNLGQKNATKDGCSTVTGNVNISVTGGTVSNLIYGGGENNTCVRGTVTIALDNVTLGANCYVNGGVLGHGAEGVRNIEKGTMTTYAVVNKVVINATGSQACVFGGGGSGSTKVVEAVVTMNNCTVDCLYASGINGEMEKSSLKAIGCKITGELAATNRGFIKTANVTLEDCYVKQLMTGATTGCFETDSGKPDGSGITGSVSWTIDDQTEVKTALLTPLAKRDEHDQTTATLDNITVDKSGDPLNIRVAEFKPHSNARVNTFLVSETGTLTLKNVEATVSTGQTLTNVGTIHMDNSSSLTVESGATFGQLGTVNGTVSGGGFINNTYAARIGTTGYNTLQDAIDGADPGATVTLLKDVTLDGDGKVNNEGILLINGKNITLDGNDKSIKAKNVTVAAGTPNGPSMINIQGGANVTVKNLTIDGKEVGEDATDNTKHGLNVYGSGTAVTVENVTIRNGNGYAIVANGSTATINGLATENNGWGGINVDSKSAPARLIINVATIGEDNSVKIENGSAETNGDPVTEINGGTFQHITKGDEITEPNLTVSGGTFSEDLSNSGYLSNDVKYQVNHATDTFSYANDLEAAQKLAQLGDDIVYLGDAGETVTLILKFNDGTTEDSEYKVAKGSTVTLPAPTRSGYNFLGWSDGETTNDAGKKVTISRNTTFNAVWSAIPAPTPTTYDVIVAEAENGEVTVDKTSVAEGEKVTVTATPAEGYEVAAVSVTSGDEKVDVTDEGDGTFTFEMPAVDVTVTVTFEAAAPAVDLPFTDVAEGDWYHGAVSFVYARGLMTGYEGTTLFGPEDALGREQAAAVLHRALGAGEHAGDCGLPDVAQSEWYAQPVNWAVETGLIAGYADGSGLFGVGDALTRDQFAAIVARVAKADLSKADPSALGAFSDGDEVAGWAVPAVSWAVQAGILEGSPDGEGGTELRASAQITRGEMAAMVMRAAEAGLLPTA